MKTDAFGAYKRYLALRLHYTTPKYDALKYNYSVKADFEKFRNKPEAYWFNQLAKKLDEQELTNAFVANFVAGKKWGGLHDVSFFPIYDDWRKRTDALTYNFEQDLIALENRFTDTPLLADLFRPTGRSLYVVDLYLRGKTVSLETLVILDKLTGFTVKCDSWITDTIQWPALRQLIHKYKPFLQFDSPTFKQILLNHFPVS